MSTTIKMVCHKLEKPQGIRLYGISDLHIGSREFNEAEFQKISREILADPDNYLVLAGDIIDNGIKSSVTSPYEAIMQPRAQRDYAAEILYPLRDRVLGWVGGNHERRSAKDADTDPAEIVASKIGCEGVYRDAMAFLLLKLNERSTNSMLRPAPIYSVCLTHGASGGATLGAGLSKADQFASISGVDLMILGHSHKAGTAPGSRLECDKGKGIMTQRNYGIMICTAWLDYGGYPMQRAMKPLPIAINHARLCGEKHGFNVVQQIT